MVERKSGFGITRLLSLKNSNLVRAAIKQFINNNSKHLIISITFDKVLNLLKYRNEIQIYRKFMMLFISSNKGYQWKLEWLFKKRIP